MNQFNHMDEIILLFIYVIILFAFKRRFSDPIFNCFLRKYITNIWLASLTYLNFPGPNHWKITDKMMCDNEFSY